MPSLTLLSGCTIDDPVERLRRFCAEEHPYYDAIPSNTPDEISPIDVLATVTVNAFYSANAAAIRRVHRGLAAACDPLLSVIPEDADLLTFDRSLAAVEALIHAAIQVPGVLIPVATKVLHRKRHHLIPILDNVVLAHYLGTALQKLPAATQEKRRAAGVAVRVLAQFRDDLKGSYHVIEPMRQRLLQHGYDLSPVRILEILLWTQVEERGYYR